ncbi:DUF7350 domain-containing protein [Halococcus agarilyticus]|uniref:DUF7350 domain-containing protein n=1 Tax=Halococcus agarilyticus TaxID=1232219 RepID=UPI000A7AF9D5|nr:hypothetical protein [Halococcus agarilyticus]
MATIWDERSGIVIPLDADIRYHYATAVEDIQPGDDLKIIVTTPPQIARRVRNRVHRYAASENDGPELSHLLALALIGRSDRSPFRTIYTVNVIGGISRNAVS